MSFLRHKQIYRPILLTSKRDSFATVPLSSCDESATGYSSASCTPAALASASPAIAIVKPIAGNRQPPLIQGWGIFTRRYGDFSAGVDRCRCICWVRRNWRDVKSYQCESVVAPIATEVPQR